MNETTFKQRYASHKRNITTLKYVLMNRDSTETAYKRKRRINDNRISGALLYMYNVSNFNCLSA